MLYYEKAFDRERHEKLLQLLCEAGLDNKDVQIIKTFTGNRRQRLNSGMKTVEMEIQRGVRQGCILSPLLFNLYSDKIFKEAVDGLDIGVKVNGVRINTIKC